MNNLKHHVTFPEDRSSGIAAPSADRGVSSQELTLQRNWGLPSFIENLVPDIDPTIRRSAFQVGRSMKDRIAPEYPSPIVAVCSKQWAATRGALAGAPIQGISSSMSRDSAVAWIAHVLSMMDPSERRSVANQALASISGPRQAHVPFFACIPSDADQHQASALIDGLGTMLLALGSAASDESASTIAAKAASIASRQPFAADPLAPASPNEVSLAKMLLDAYLADEGLRDEVFHSEPFRQALEAVAAEAGMESASSVVREGELAEDSMSEEELRLQRAIYDCVTHAYPLGGFPMAGGKFKDWIKKAGQKIGAFIKDVDGLASDGQKAREQAVRVKRASEADRQKFWEEREKQLHPTFTAKQISDRARSAAAAEAAEAAAAANGSAADAVAAESEGSTALTDSVSASRQLLDEALAKLTEAKGNMAAQQEQIRADARDYAKLLWANEILQAGDDVADILAGVRPSTSDPGSFISTALSILPAAKASGNLTTIKAVANAIRAAATRSGVAEGSVLSLLTGDPEALAAQDTEVATPVAVADSISRRVKGSWGGVQPEEEAPAEEELPAPAGDALSEAAVEPVNDTSQEASGLELTAADEEGGNHENTE